MGRGVKINLRRVLHPIDQWSNPVDILPSLNNAVGIDTHFHFDKLQQRTGCQNPGEALYCGPLPSSSILISKALAIFCFVQLAFHHTFEIYFTNPSNIRWHGYYPRSALEWNKHYLLELQALLSSGCRKVVAFGEIELDYSYGCNVFIRSKEQEVLRILLSVGPNNSPIIIHAS